MSTFKFPAIISIAILCIFTVISCQKDAVEKPETQSVSAESADEVVINERICIDTWADAQTYGLSSNLRVRNVRLANGLTLNRDSYWEDFTLTAAASGTEAYYTFQIFTTEGQQYSNDFARGCGNFPVHNTNIQRNDTLFVTQLGYFASLCCGQGISEVTKITLRP